MLGGLDMFKPRARCGPWRLHRSAFHYGASRDLDERVAMTINAENVQQAAQQMRRLDGLLQEDL